MTNPNNDNSIETVYELINQYGLKAIPEAMTIRLVFAAKYPIALGASKE